MSSFTFDDSAFSDVIDHLNDVADKAKSLSGSTVSFDILFNTTFMNQHTSVSTFNEFLTLGNFTVESEDDFEAIPDELMDAHVSSSTDFSSWEDMFEAASSDYLEQQLDF